MDNKTPEELEDLSHANKIKIDEFKRNLASVDAGKIGCSPKQRQFTNDEISKLETENNNIDKELKKRLQNETEIRDKENKDLIELQKDHLKTNTEDIKKNPYRFRFNLVVSIIGALTGIFALIYSVRQNTEIKELKKSQLQQDSILRKYVSDKYEFLRKNSIKAENDILLLKKLAKDSTTKPSSTKHLSKP
ncbi:MAG: hypothetical protein ACYDCN_14850 [Bacteroidia bacterium]